MNNDSLQRLVAGWLEYNRTAQVSELSLGKSTASDELFQFVIEVDDLVRNDPERAWLVIQLIFVACRTDIERACLAAGPLEDLLSKHGSSFIDRIEQTASSNSDFRELLVGVWRNGIAYPVWERLQRAAGIT
jgi:hypothetical protein